MRYFQHEDAYMHKSANFVLTTRCKKQFKGLGRAPPLLLRARMARIEIDVAMRIQKNYKSP